MSQKLESLRTCTVFLDELIRAARSTPPTKAKPDLQVRHLDTPESLQACCSGVLGFESQVGHQNSKENSMTEEMQEYYASLSLIERVEMMIEQLKSCSIGTVKDNPGGREFLELHTEKLRSAYAELDRVKSMSEYIGQELINDGYCGQKALVHIVKFDDHLWAVHELGYFRWFPRTGELGS